MMSIENEDLNIVLGRWDYDIRKSIEIVQSELNESGTDFIDTLLEAEKKSNGKLCINNHLNENVRGNQKYCRICRASLMDPEEEHEEHDEELDDAEDDISELIIDQSVIPKTVKVNPITINQDGSTTVLTSSSAMQLG